MKEKYGKLVNGRIEELGEETHRFVHGELTNLKLLLVLFYIFEWRQATVRTHSHHWAGPGLTKFLNMKPLGQFMGLAC